MSGFFGVVSKKDCVMPLFFGVDYHSHLGTKRGGMAVYGSDGFQRSIHNIENSPFRTKFERDVNEMSGNCGIGCISDYEPQPLLIQSHLGSFAITTVGKINNAKTLLFMPDLFNFFLTGEKKCEYTVASTSQMFDSREHKWAKDLLDLC